MKDDITTTLAAEDAATSAPMAAPAAELPLGLGSAFDVIGIGPESSTMTGPVETRLRSMGAVAAVLIGLVVVAVVLALTGASAVMDVLGRVG